MMITLDGKSARMVPTKDSAVDALRGILKDAPADLDRHSIREERLEKYDRSPVL